MTAPWTAIAPILLLIASNVFMTFAWYGRLKVEKGPLWIIVMASWGIASSNTGWRCRPIGSGGPSTIPQS